MRYFVVDRALGIGLYIRAEVVGFTTGDEMIDRQTADRILGDWATFSRDELEGVDGGPQALEAWEAGDDSVWQAQCRRRGRSCSALHRRESVGFPRGR